MNKIKRTVMSAAICAVQLLTAVTFSLPASAAVTDARIDTIAVGANHTLVIKSDNTLWGSGKNDFKQLSGASSEDYTATPVKIMSNVISVAAGGDTSFAIDADNNLYAWGSNGDGQIDTQPYDTISTPTKLLSGIKSVSASSTHVLAVATDGSLYAWGSNQFGELGYTVSNVKNPIKEIMDNVVCASAGEGFSLVVTKDGALYSFGANESGQLGIGSYTDVTVPALAIKSGVTMAAAGKSHSVILKSDGTVYCAGLNDDGQLGIGTFGLKTSFTKVNISDVKYVFAGGNTSAALNTKNNLYTWGSNDYGQLHNGKTDDEESPISITTGIVSFAVSNTYSIMLKDNGTLSAVGMGVYGELMEETKSSVSNPVLVGKSYVSISAGRNHVGAINTSGDLYMWGGNEFGQLGTGDYNLRVRPTKVTLGENEKAQQVWCGNGYTFVRTQNGVFYCFGSNATYQLGMTTKTDYINKPTENEDLTGTGAELSLTSDHVVALIGGKVYGWGKNTSSTLGLLGDLVKSPEVIDDDLVDIYEVSASDYHTIALERGGRIWAWGSNSSGQLAIDGIRYTKVPELAEITSTKYVITDGVREKVEYEVLFTSVIAAGSHTIAIDESGTIWAWGSNPYGQCGTTSSKLSEPTQINATAYILVSTDTASATINSSDKLYFSGKNTSGRFGTDSDKDLTSFSTLTASNVSTVAIGDDFTAYILNDGSLYTCGSNQQGQLGNGAGGMKATPSIVLSGCLTAAAVKAESIKLDASEITLKPDQTKTLTATVLPAEALNKTVVWKTSDEKIATVKDGIVIAKSVGVATITASTTDGAIYANCKVNVTIPVTLVSIKGASKSLVQGKTYQIDIKVYPEKAIDRTVKYTSSNEQVAKVSATGLVTAVGAGKAIITATSVSNGTVSDTITIKVTPGKTTITSKTRSSAGITLKWKDMGNITGYEIFRKVTKSGTYKSIADVEDATMFLDKNVKKGKYYYYKIKTYTIVDGVKVYSKYSKVVYIKFK